MKRLFKPICTDHLLPLFVLLTPQASTVNSRVRTIFMGPVRMLNETSPDILEHSSPYLLLLDNHLRQKGPFLTLVSIYMVQALTVFLDNIYLSVTPILHE